MPVGESLKLLNSFAERTEKRSNERRNKENRRPTALLKRFARGEGGGVQRAPNQESEAGGNWENNKKWTERKEPAGIEDGERAVKKREDGRGETSPVPRKLLAGEYTAATDSFRGTS